MMERNWPAYARTGSAAERASILFLGVVLCCLTVYSAQAPQQHEHLSRVAAPTVSRAPFEAIVQNSDSEEAVLPAGIPETPESDIHDIIVQVAGRHDVDAALIMAIVEAESRYNPNAVSSKGAMGLMQLMPGTAEDLGVKDGFNPEENLDGGVRYFKQLLKRLDGDVTLALAAYNAGLRHVRNYSGVPPFRATRYYVEKVLEYYRKYKARLAGTGHSAPSVDAKQQAALS